jgi:hypothetical protein
VCLPLVGRDNETEQLIGNKENNRTTEWKVRNCDTDFA